MITSSFIFKLGNSSFDVQMFDKFQIFENPNLCEKESSYFARKFEEKDVLRRPNIGVYKWWFYQEKVFESKMDKVFDSNTSKSIDFFQILSRFYLQLLPIPPKFASTIKGKVGETFSLTISTGARWDVRLTAHGDNLFFEHGWGNFIADNSLTENDVVLFRYDGQSKFDVTLLDARYLYEKEVISSTRRCDEHTESESNIGSKRKANSPDKFESSNAREPSPHFAESFHPKKPRKQYARTPPSVVGQQANKGNINNIPRKPRSCIKPRPADTLVDSSNRRTVSEEEKEAALRRAHEAASENSFVLVMRPTHVYKGFYLTIPLKWLKTHLPHTSQDILLKVGENSWQVRFHRKESCAALTGGWKNFVVDNVLQEFDVCLFKLVNNSPDCIVMDVSIFRVVKNMIGPSRLNPKSSRGRKSKYLRGRYNTIPAAALD